MRHDKLDSGLFFLFLDSSGLHVFMKSRFNISDIETPRCTFTEHEINASALLKTMVLWHGPDCHRGRAWENRNLHTRFGKQWLSGTSQSTTGKTAHISNVLEIFQPITESKGTPFLKAKRRLEQSKGKYSRRVPQLTAIYACSV